MPNLHPLLQLTPILAILFAGTAFVMLVGAAAYSWGDRVGFRRGWARSEHMYKAHKERVDKLVNEPVYRKSERTPFERGEMPPVKTPAEIKAALAKIAPEAAKKKPGKKGNDKARRT